MSHEGITKQIGVVEMANTSFLIRKDKLERIREIAGGSRKLGPELRRLVDERIEEVEQEAA